VHFPLTPEGIQAAVNATSAIHQVTIDRVTYDCSLSHSLEVMMNPDQQQQLQAHLHNSSNQPKHHQIQQSKEHHHNLHHNQQQHNDDHHHHQQQQHHHSHHQAHHSSIHPGEPTFAAAVAASLHHNNNESSSNAHNNPSSLSSLHAISQSTAGAGNTNSNSSPAALLGNPLTNPPAGGGLGMPVQLSSSSSLQGNNNAGSGPPPLIPNPNLMFHQQPQGGIGGQGGDLRGGGDYNDPNHNNNNNNNIDLLSKGFQDSSFMMNPSPYPGSHLPHLAPHLPPHQGGGPPPPPFHPSYLHQPNFHHGMFYNPPPHGLGDPNTPPLFNPSLVGGMRGSPDHLAMNGMNLSGMNPHPHLGSVGGMDHGSNQFPPSFFNYGAPPPPPPGHDGFHPQGHDPATMHFLFAPSSHMNEFTPGIGLTSGSHGESSSNVLNEYK
jgi:uncharacterized cupredoxin-like copper-binding protein